MKARRLLLLIFIVLSSSQGLASYKTKNAQGVRSAIEPLRERLQQSSAVLTDERGKSFSYGVIVSSEGEILTKASVLEGVERFTVRVDRTAYEADLSALSREWDVALLSLKEASGLTPVTWSEGSKVEKGTLVVSNAATSLRKRRARLGVVSAEQRPVHGAVVALPLLIHSGKEGVLKVAELIEGFEKEASGLAVGDVLLTLGGEALSSQEDFENHAEGKWPGEQVELTVERGKKRLALNLTYGWKHTIFPAPMDRNEAMSGRFSGRRTGFPEVIQHDTVLSHRTIGGPLLSLSGLCLGMNIARVNRAETFAIPSARLQEILLGLRAQKASSKETGQ